MRTRTIAAAALTLTLAVGGLWGWVEFDRRILSTLPQDLSSYRDWRPSTTCTVHAADGQIVDEFYLERRRWVDLADLPPHVPAAFLAAEDRRFYEHPGVDLAGVLRAVIANLQSGGVSQGGSTLTQQLVKNLIVGSERSYDRKLKEAIVSWRLERELGKDRILELYLNYVYLGSGNHGVEAAARDYFGVSASELDPGQAALLAGLVPAPSRYQPRAHPDTARLRRAIVLRSMVEEQVLTAQEATAFLDAPVLSETPDTSGPREALAYTTQVRREIRRLFGETEPFERGLVVHTALDRELQRLAEDAVRDGIDALEARQGPAALGALVPVADRAAYGADELPGPCFSALVGRNLDDLRYGPHRFRLAKEDRAGAVRGDGEAGPLTQLARSGRTLRVCSTDDATLVVLDRTRTTEGAAVVLDRETGQVLALVGGYEPSFEGFVRATQGRRQPGSSFKPYVYAAALREHHGPLDTVVDRPLSLPAGGGEVWAPKNYGGGFAGPISLRRALATSSNTVAVRLALEVGPARVAALARSLGVASPIRHDPTMALGSSEVTPLDQAIAYRTLVSGGERRDATYLVRVVGHGGLDAGPGDVIALGQDTVTLPGGPGPVVLDPGVAYEVADMMREVVQSGTAQRTRRPGLDRGGKTGTTNDNVDAWFVGFTANHVIAVWVGAEGAASLGDKETGGRAALPIWTALADALAEPEGARIPIPPQAMLVKTDAGWIGLRRGAERKPLRVPRLADGQPLPIPD